MKEWNNKHSYLQVKKLESILIPELFLTVINKC